MMFNYGSMHDFSSAQRENEPEKDHVSHWLNVILKLNTRAIFSLSFKDNSKVLSKSLQDAISSGNVYLLMGSIPHTWLLPQCAAIVHHGGAGTTQTAAYCGIPSVVISHISDQPFMGGLLHHLGIAPPGIPLKKFTEEKLYDALKDVLIDHRDKFQRSAKELQARMKRETPIADSVAVVTKYLASLEKKQVGKE